jgi:hypothetical protein
MLSRHSKDLTTGRRIVLMIRWSLELALLLGVVSLLIGSPQDDPVTRAVRSGATGIVLGALIGATDARLVTGWRNGAIIGAICGAIVGVLRWIVTIALGPGGTPGGPVRYAFLVLLNAIAGLAYGALRGSLFPDGTKLVKDLPYEEA